MKSLLTSAGTLASGWRLEVVTGMSADGRTLLGWGLNHASLTQAFLVTVPEPG